VSTSAFIKNTSLVIITKWHRQLVSLEARLGPLNFRGVEIFLLNNVSHARRKRFYKTRTRVSLGLVPCGTLTPRLFLSPSTPLYVSLLAIPHGSEFSGIFHGRIRAFLSRTVQPYKTVLVSPAAIGSVQPIIRSPTISLSLRPFSRIQPLLLMVGRRSPHTLIVKKRLFVEIFSPQVKRLNTFSYNGPHMRGG